MRSRRVAFRNGAMGVAKAMRVAWSKKEMPWRADHAGSDPELCAEAARQDSAALVLAVGHHTELVHFADPDPVMRLNRLLQSGGRPVGILGWRTVAGETRWSSRPLQECADEAWGRPPLQAVAAAEDGAGAIDATLPDI